MKAARISEAFNVSLFRANIALSVIKGRIRPQDFPRRFPETFAWVESCYNSPSFSEIKMEALNEILECHGVEPVHDGRFYVDHYHGDIVATYLNMGDAYLTTIVRDNLKKTLRLMSWGDFVESLDAKFAEELDDG